MKKIINTLILAALLSLGIGITGCASTPEQAPVEKSESDRASGSVTAPEPANESDDMERLD